MTDEQLVQGCIEKNTVAQKQLYYKYSRKMMGVCLRYCDRNEEGEDILQMGFINVFENIEAYRGIGPLEGWIRKIIVNAALTNLRKTKKLRNNIDIESSEFTNSLSSDYSDGFEAKELLKMIQTLPTGFRTVFNLHAIEGYSHKEIAEMLGITEGTSKSQYSRAKLHLQKLLLEQNK